MRYSKALPRFILLITIFTLALAAGMPKAVRQNIAQGDLKFAEDNYEAALPFYLEAFKLDPSNANLC
ncbi:MAG TPA: hypothetical protein VL651_05585, partial [Bacteroidia bacterium]|nr:hypothetical protein [Bacteroidia bacterium]